MNPIRALGLLVKWGLILGVGSVFTLYLGAHAYDAIQEDPYSNEEYMDHRNRTLQILKLSDECLKDHEITEHFEKEYIARDALGDLADTSDVRIERRGGHPAMTETYYCYAGGDNR